MILSYLSTAGFETVEASHGEEALTLMENADIDLILTDLEMPVMDGFEFIQNLNEQEIYRGIPIVTLTTHDSSSLREKAMELGVKGYLVKMDRSELIDTVDRLLQERVAS